MYTEYSTSGLTEEEDIREWDSYFSFLMGALLGFGDYQRIYRHGVAKRVVFLIPIMYSPTRISR